MREIKFRVWNKVTKTMHYPSWKELAVRAGLVEMELMQYTGLKDKNSIEIYEGDIVADTDLVIDDVISVIEWGQCDELSDYTTERTTMSGWVANSKLYGVSPFFPYSCTKVIGNIYENKELLK